MADERKTILAIDDDITLLNTIQTILAGTYEISLAKNTDIAKTILNTTVIDLILLDMNMPGASGLDFLDFIRNDVSYYFIPVIIVSAQGTADVIMEIKEKGAAGFVVKPISPKILMEKISSVLKTTKTKIGREPLKRKLERLLISCTAGKGSSVESIVQELEERYFELEADAEIAKICGYARDMEYKLVEEKVKQLLRNLPG